MKEEMVARAMLVLVGYVCLLMGIVAAMVGYVVIAILIITMGVFLMIIASRNKFKK